MKKYLNKICILAVLLIFIPFISACEQSEAELLIDEMFISIEDQIYTGDEISPEIIINNEYNETIDFNINEYYDFTTKYDNNINVGTATVTITGKYAYTGEVILSFDIIPMTITSNMFEIKDQVYTGENVIAEIIANKDITYDVVEYKENVDVESNSQVIIEGKGNYCGEITLDFDIKYNISDYLVDRVEDVLYTGDKADINLFNNFVSEENYDISITGDEINVTDAGVLINITAKGDLFTGEAVLSYNILPIIITESFFSEIESQIYSGEILVPNIVSELENDSYKIINSFDMINAGNYLIYLQGTGNYSGKILLKFTIQSKSIENDEYFISEIPSFAYTSIEITPNIVIDGLSETDYIVSFSNNIDGGVASVIVTATGNYQGNLYADFNIYYEIMQFVVDSIEDQVYSGNVSNIQYFTENISETEYSIVIEGDQINVTEDGVKVTITAITSLYEGEVVLTYHIIPQEIDESYFDAFESQTYTGGILYPEPISEILDYSTDYYISYNQQLICVDTYQIKIIGYGNYTGCFYMDFNVVKKSFADADIIVSSLSDEIYTSDEIKPTISVKGFVQDYDYFIEYSSNINAGVGIVTITGMGNCCDVKYIYFNILQQNIAEEMFVLDSKEYTGFSLTTDIFAKDDVTYEILEYSNNINVTTMAVVSVQGTGNYTGTLELTFEITAKSIEDGNYFINDIDAQIYYYEALMPEVSIDGLSADDYIVSYEDNDKMGTAIVTITAKGNYTGILSTTFIVKDHISKILESNLSDLTYTGITIDRDIFLKDVDSSNYDIEITGDTINVTEEGISITITAKGDNYGGEAILTYYILPTNLINDYFETIVESQVYTGKNLTPTIISTLENTDYIFDNSIELINAKEYTLSVQGIGNYTGTLELTFEIISKSIEDGIYFINDIAIQQYNDTAVTPEISIDGLSNDDYDISYYDNNGVGTGTVTIIAKGNYNGTLSAMFIIQENISKILVSGLSDLTYTGIAVDREIFTETVDSSNYDIEITGDTINVTEEGISITITAKGDNYAGQVVLTYYIQPAVLTDDYFELEALPQIYTGENLTPIIVSTIDSENYSLDDSVELINANQYNLTIEGIRNYTGNVIISFTINPKSIASVDIVFDSIDDVEYNFGELTPEVTADDLEANLDYTYSFINNDIIGISTVTIVGIGNYDSSTSITFNITKISLKSSYFNSLGDVKYTGEEIKPNIVSSINSEYFEVSYSSNINGGVATVNVNAIGDYYTGEIDLSFNIYYTITYNYNYTSVLSCYSSANPTISINYYVGDTIDLKTQISIVEYKYIGYYYKSFVTMSNCYYFAYMEYQFNGWFNGSSQLLSNSDISSNITFTASWSLVTGNYSANYTTKSDSSQGYTSTSGTYSYIVRTDDSSSTSLGSQGYIISSTVYKKIGITTVGTWYLTSTRDFSSTLYTQYSGDVDSDKCSTGSYIPSYM